MQVKVAFQLRLYCADFRQNAAIASTSPLMCALHSETRVCARAWDQRLDPLRAPNTLALKCCVCAHNSGSFRSDLTEACLFSSRWVLLTGTGFRCTETRSQHRSLCSRKRPPIGPGWSGPTSDWLMKTSK